MLASGHDDNLIRVWSTETWRLVRQLEAAEGKRGVASVCFDRENRLAAGYVDGAALVWETERWGLISRLDCNQNLNHCVAFSQSGLLAAACEKVLTIWEEVTGPLD